MADVRFLKSEVVITQPWTEHRSKTANITKDDITLQHSDVLVMCCTSNIIFCDIWCFRSASWQMSSL